MSWLLICIYTVIGSALTCSNAQDIRAKYPKADVIVLAVWHCWTWPWWALKK